MVFSIQASAVGKTKERKWSICFPNGKPVCHILPGKDLNQAIRVTPAGNIQFLLQGNYIKKIKCMTTGYRQMG
jgi:hypothetical protein